MFDSSRRAVCSAAILECGYRRSIDLHFLYFYFCFFSTFLLIFTPLSYRSSSQKAALFSICVAPQRRIIATFTKNHVSISSISTEDAVDLPTETWKPLTQEYLVMLTVSILSLMVALDATILVPVLPVRPNHRLAADIHN
jgi:hypothetical protein